MSDRRPSGFHFMTPVWGEAYIRLLLDIVMPAQLAPGNLPGLRDLDRCRYLIYTTPADAEIIVSAPVYRALSTTIPVQIEFIADQMNVPHDAMSNCYRRGISLADARGAAAVFLTPDLVFSDGAFKRLQDLAGEGCRVVYIAGIRLIKQRAARALQDKFMTGDVIAVGPRDLMAIALQNLHPLAISSFWEEGDDDLIPANLYWRAGEHGILARCFHLHPVLVLPERKHAIFFGTVDDDYVPAACPDPSGDYVSRDSDELLAVELSDLDHHFLTGLRKRSLDDVAYWADMATHGRHRSLLKVPIRLHTGMVDEASWRVAERRSSEVAASIESLLDRPDLRLLWSSPRTLERRLFRRAREKQLQLVNQPRRASGATVDRRSIDALAGSIPPQIDLPRTLAVKVTAWCLASLNVRARLLQGFVFALGAYARSLSRWARLLSRLRQTVTGPPTAPTILNMSWLYVRQLSRHVRESLVDLEAEPVVCEDGGEFSIGRMAEGSGRSRAALVIGRDRAAGLVDATTGAPLADGSVRSIVLDTTLQRSGDLQGIATEVARVLKDGGRMLIRIDRLPGGRNPMPEVYLSVHAAAEALQPRLEIVCDRRQGGMGTAWLMMLRSYRRQQASRVRIPYLIWSFTVLAITPIELLAVIAMNILGLLWDRLDTTRRNYLSCLIVARKAEASTVGHAGSGGGSGQE